MGSSLSPALGDRCGPQPSPAQEQREGGAQREQGAKEQRKAEKSRKRVMSLTPKKQEET